MEEKDVITKAQGGYDEESGTWIPLGRRPRADTEPGPTTEEHFHLSLSLLRRTSTWATNQAFHDTYEHNISLDEIKSNRVDPELVLKLDDGVEMERNVENTREPVVSKYAEYLQDKLRRSSTISMIERFSIFKCLDVSGSQLINGDRENRDEMSTIHNIFCILAESSWILLLILGICTSVIAWTIDELVLEIAHLHKSFTSIGNGWFTKYIIWLGFRVAILLLGVGVTHYISPSSAGSGIPEMRSILGGFTLPYYLSGRTLVAKCLGLICALGSGISIGKEGPFVHLSCIIANQLLKFEVFRKIQRSPDLTHHVLSAACAAGITATFGAPIGGVLFSIEVTTTYYMTTNYWRAFFCSVVGLVVFRWLNEFSSWGNPVSLFTTNFEILPYRVYEIAFFLFLASFCGLLGGLFVRTFSRVVQLRRDNQSRLFGSKPFKFAAIICLLFGLIEYPVGSFMILSSREAVDDLFSATNLTGAVNTHLGKRFNKSWGTPSLIINLLAFSIVRFFSTAASATLAVPNGIVTPIFGIGAAVGRLFGEIVSYMGGGSQIPGGYAVVGAASFTAGVTGTVSIAVIVFELTSQLSYMVPVLLSVLVGRAVGSFISLDIYETIARDRHLPQWPNITKLDSYSLVACDMMRAVPAYSLNRHQTRSSLCSLLESFPDVAVFPVVDEQFTMVYLGVVDRFELEALVEIWQRCLHKDSVIQRKELFFPKLDEETKSSDQDSRNATGSSILQGLCLNDSDRNASDLPGWSLSPNSRHMAIASEQAVSGLTDDQIEPLMDSSSDRKTCIDLVSLGFLSLDSVNFHVNRDTFASHVVLLISVHKCPQLFVTGRGRLIGVIHAVDFVAKGRQAPL